MEDQNRFISLAKDGETRTPSTGTNMIFHQPQIVAIQDTKIDSSISTSELVPETCPYSVYRKDRNSKGGGVMLLIHKMPFTELENDPESVWVKVFANKTLFILWQVGINLLVEI